MNKELIYLKKNHLFHLFILNLRPKFSYKFYRGGMRK